MKNIEKNLWLVAFPRIVLCLFVLLNIVSMLSYSGGTYMNNKNFGYSFTQNFLSDLGRTMSFSDEINFFSAQFFNMSLILAGSVFVFFYFHAIPVNFEKFCEWFPCAHD